MGSKINPSLARVAADLRLQHGWTFAKIGAWLAVSSKTARKLAASGGWERPCWPPVVTRITKERRAFVVRRTACGP